MTNEEISLRDFFESLLSERQKADHAQWASHNAVHLQESQARSIAEIEINRRLNELNELRKQVIDDRFQFITKPEFYLSRDSMTTDIAAHEKWKNQMEGTFRTLVWIIVGACGAVTTVINLVFRWVGK